jgi:hypothetical protein
MRVKSLAITVVVLAIGAAPAVAAKQTALRSVPKPSSTVIKPAKPAAPVSRPSAVWIPSPSSGIKWTGGVRIAVRFR